MTGTTKSEVRMRFCSQSTLSPRLIINNIGTRANDQLLEDKEKAEEAFGSQRVRQVRSFYQVKSLIRDAAARSQHHPEPLSGMEIIHFQGSFYLLVQNGKYRSQVVSISMPNPSFTR